VKAYIVGAGTFDDPFQFQIKNTSHKHVAAYSIRLIWIINQIGQVQVYCGDLNYTIIYK